MLRESGRMFAYAMKGYDGEMWAVARTHAPLTVSIAALSFLSVPSVPSARSVVNPPVPSP